MDHLSFQNQSNNSDRRRFLLRTAQSISALAMLDLKPVFAIEDTSGTKKPVTIQEVINLILKEGGLTTLKDTVDTIKTGNPDQIVTGILTTMFPTITVIEEAAKRNANFIIAHEPSFYNHKDDTGWVKDNSVLRQKMELLEKHKIAIWRFHDYCHALTPDAVKYGVAKKAGWLPYYKNQQVITIPAITLQQLVQHLKTSLGISHVRVIGDLKQQCERISLIPGAAGGKTQVSVVESEKPDVLIVGEVSEWETAEYIRDGKLLGGKTALIILGHAVSEEPGMEWFAEWLRPKLAGVKISHLASGDPFVWL